MNDQTLESRPAPPAPLAGSPASGHGGTSARPAPASTAAFGVAVAALVLAGAVGALERAWLLVHLPLTSDEAVVGLMARRLAAGHFSTFYWGQQYGGLEPYVAVPFHWLVGGTLGLDLTATALSAASAVLAGLIVAGVTGRRLLGWLAGAVVWVWPYALMWNSVRELGFRLATLCCGLVLVLCAHRLRRGRHGVGTAAALGLALGAGWWASPEILYFAVPAAVLVLAPGGQAAPGRGGSGQASGALAGRLGARVVVPAAVGAVVGALPWLYTNVLDGFASVRPGAEPASSGLTYAGRLSVFFHQVLPAQLGTKALWTGAWVGGPVVGRLVLATLAAVLLAAAGRGVWAAARRQGGAEILALAAGLVAFPFVFAANPGAGYWADGRYGIYLGPLAVLLVFVALGTHAAKPVHRSQRWHRQRAGMAVGTALLAGASVLAVAGAATTESTPATSLTAFFGGWHDPDGAMQRVLGRMEAAGLGDAYGGYWTAYDLEFLGAGRVAVSPSPLDVVRWPSLAREVEASAQPAWLFYAPDRVAEATRLFSNAQPGPGGYTAGTFEAYLQRARVPYRVVPLGVMVAVVPGRHVHPPPPGPGAAQ